MISNLVNRVVYVGDGVTTVFPVTFPFFEDGDLSVYTRVIATGAQALLVLNSNYTVSGGDGSTGSIMMALAYANTIQIVIERNTALAQLSDYQNQAAIPAETLEHDFDRGAMRDQEIARTFARTPHYPSSDDPALGSELPTSVQRANKLAGYDLNGKPTAVDPVTLSPGTVLLGVPAQSLLPLPTFDDWRTSLSAVQNISGFAGLQQNVFAALPVPVANSFRLFLARDNLRLFYNGISAAWFEIGIGQYTYAGLPVATAPGRLLLDTDNLRFLRDNGASIDEVRAPFPRGAIGGLRVDYTTSGSLTIQPGECRTGTAANPSLENAYLAAALLKDVSTGGGWSAGGGGRGRPGGVAFGSDTWFHVFLIQTPGGAVDAGIDTSINAVNLLADAAVSAAGYTRFRRIASVRTDSGGGLQRWQQNGDDFRFVAPPPVESSANANQSGSDKTLLLTQAPTGFTKRVVFRTVVEFNAAVNNMLVVGSFESIGANPGNNTTPMANFFYDGGSQFSARRDLDLLLDSTNTVKFRASAANNMKVNTQVVGWCDPRGREL